MNDLMLEAYDAGPSVAEWNEELTHRHASAIAVLDGARKKRARREVAAAKKTLRACVAERDRFDLACDALRMAAHWQAAVQLSRQTAFFQLGRLYCIREQARAMRNGGA